MQQKPLATGVPMQSPIKLLTGRDIKAAVSFPSQFYQHTVAIGPEGTPALLFLPSSGSFQT
jgi:hypothetical protein